MIAGVGIDRVRVDCDTFSVVLTSISQNIRMTCPCGTDD